MPSQKQEKRPGSDVVKDIASGKWSFEFDFWLGHVGHSVVNSSSPLWRFFEAVLLTR